MGHGKLKKFRENETFSCLLQPDSEDVVCIGETGLALKDHKVKGNWNSTVFAKPQPIILELGCGKGEYTIDLALRNPKFNYIGLDIKGARLWKGAKYATENNLPNVAFLRTRIEFIQAFFAPGEVSEIWLTFSDPQIKSENSRLTSPGFMENYRTFLKEGGVVHLKTDSMFLHQYSKAVVSHNGMTVLACTEDLYGEGREKLESGSKLKSVCGDDAVEALFEVQTFYEKMFLAQGQKITYLSFMIDCPGKIAYPEFDNDYWKAVEGPRKSFGRGG